MVFSSAVSLPQVDLSETGGGSRLSAIAGHPGRRVGVSATRAVGAATSNILPVRDSLYFAEGDGAIPGDTIQLRARPSH